MIETPRSSAPSTLEPASPDVDAPRYAIDIAWFDAHHLSLEDLARQRLCDACRARAGQEIAERVPVFDKESGRMQMEERGGVYGQDPLKLIKDHCGRSKNFIHRDMPTLEAVFRILLANGNAPLSLEEIRDQLAEWCPGGGCQWLLLPMEAFQRLVQKDSSYGLRRVETPTGT